MQQILNQKLNDLFDFLGYQKFETPDTIFSEARVIKLDLLRGNIAFLIYRYSTNENIKDVVNKARDWSKMTLHPNKFTNPVTLNIVFIHNGEINPTDFKGLPDKTGFHLSLLRSLTAINTTTGHVFLESYGTGPLMNATSKLATTILALSILDIKTDSNIRNEPNV